MTKECEVNRSCYPVVLAEDYTASIDGCCFFRNPRKNLLANISNKNLASRLSLTFSFRSPRNLKLLHYVALRLEKSTLVHPFLISFGDRSTCLFRTFSWGPARCVRKFQTFKKVISIRILFLLCSQPSPHLEPGTWPRTT